MIDSLVTIFLNGYAYIRKHPQLLLTVVLVLVIPLAFIISGQQFLGAAKINQEQLELSRIGTIQDLFVSILTVSDYDIAKVQSEITKFVSLNPDIQVFDIAKDENQKVTILASSNEGDVQTTIGDPTLYRTSLADSTHTYTIPRIFDGIRHLDSYRSVRTDSGDVYYIHTEISLGAMDREFSENIVRAYYWLFGILGVILLLILRHVRLIDYAYLYSETKKANEMKDLFTNMIAHELRAPLTAMRGYASLISEHASADQYTKEQAVKIGNSSSRLLSIVSDLLDVGRMHSGKLSIKNQRTDLHKIIAAVVETMQISAKEKNIELLHEDVTPDIFINVDEKRLFQALTNLVSNSIKYTKSGTISISVKPLSDRVEIRVKDTGMGISAENQRNLFMPFFRIETMETEGTVGTGLGMWITKQLIDLMKGSIGVESIKGVGTHIVVTLPK